MIKANLKKAVVMGLGMALLSSNLVFAQVRTEQEIEIKGEIAAVEPAVTIMDKAEIIAPDEGVSKANTGTGEIGEGSIGFEGNEEADVIMEPVHEPIYFTTTADATDADLAAYSGLAEENEKLDPDQPVSSDDELKIQITSIDADAYAAAEEYDLEQLKRTAAESNPIMATADKESSVDTSLIILAIAGGVAVVGGAILASKKKNNK